ncbi:hypothetical protein AYI70_g7157, partial [Smittium culicis]
MRRKKRDQTEILKAIVLELEYS